MMHTSMSSPAMIGHSGACFGRTRASSVMQRSTVCIQSKKLSARIRGSTSSSHQWQCASKPFNGLRVLSPMLCDRSMRLTCTACRHQAQSNRRPACKGTPLASHMRSALFSPFPRTLHPPCNVLLWTSCGGSKGRRHMICNRAQSNHLQACTSSLMWRVRAPRPVRALHWQAINATEHASCAARPSRRSGELLAHAATPVACDPCGRPSRFLVECLCE